jgi:hypothetical protein
MRRRTLLMNVVQLAAKLGGKINGPWINTRGPGHSKDDLSLGIRFDPDAPDGFAVHSFAGDDPSACRKYAKEKLKDLSTIGMVIPESDDHVHGPTIAKLSVFALHLWAETLPIEGTPAAVYLESRGCAPPKRSSWSAELRFHPTCPFRTFASPALIALMRDVVTGKPTGIHRTALSDDGCSKRKMPSGLQAKMMLGRSSKAAVQIRSAGSILGLAEGIETTLSAERIFKVPVWAAMSAVGIGSFPVIYGVTCLFIFADNDKAGLSAARECKRRYQKAGIEVQVRFPQENGNRLERLLV